MHTSWGESREGGRLQLSLSDERARIRSELEEVETRKAEPSEELASSEEKLNAQQQGQPPISPPTSDDEQSQDRGLYLDGNKPIILYYILQGRIGKIVLKPDGSVTVTELLQGRLPLGQDQEDTEQAWKFRANKNYLPDNHGRAMCWVSSGSELKATNKLNSLVSDSDRIRRLEYLLTRNKCCIPWEDRRYVTGCGILGYGCSDDAFTAIQIGTVKMVLSALDIVQYFSNEKLVRSLPSTTLAANDEARLAADLICVTRQDLVDNKVDTFASTTDHGHRKGQEHYVKNGHYAAKDEKGRKTIKSICIDADKCGHGADISSRNHLS